MCAAKELSGNDGIDHPGKAGSKAKKLVFGPEVIDKVYDIVPQMAL